MNNGNRGDIMYFDNENFLKILERIAVAFERLAFLEGKKNPWADIDFSKLKSPGPYVPYVKLENE